MLSIESELPASNPEVNKTALVKAPYKEKLMKGYMYIGHIPHGFYEEQMRSYFSQFGKVFRIRLARSKKTGKHKGYGFIEFKEEKVAQIAAETMNNYLMFNKLLKCQVIPKKKLHPLAFKNSNKIFQVPVKSLFRKKHNQMKSKKELKELRQRSEKKLLQKEKKLKDLGIDLDFTKIFGVQKEQNRISVGKEKKKLKSKTEKPAKSVEGKEIKVDF